MNMARQDYYQKNKERIKEQNRLNYHKKKDDPDHYQKLLERNQQYYEKKGRKEAEYKPLPPLTDEERKRDEKQMYEIMAWIKEINQNDKHEQNKNFMYY